MSNLQPTRKCLIYVGDIHFREDKPAKRLDDPVQALSNAFDSVKELIDQYKPVCLLFGGDLGHRAEWSTSLVLEVGQILGKLKIPIWTAIGNHDIHGYSYSEFKRTGIYACANLGYINLLNEAVPLMIDSFSIKSINAGTEEEKILRETGLITGYKEKNCLNIVVVHSPVGPFGTPSQKSYKDIDVVGYDVGLFADIHESFPIHRTKSGCTIANPGSLCRWRVNDSNRTLMVAIVWDDGIVEYKKILTEKTEDVFVPVIKKKSIVSYLEAINTSIQIQEKLTPARLVETVGAQFNFSQESIKQLKDLV